MRFEKLNEDKIRITLNKKDLEKKDIDFHSFMANSIDSQDLFFDVLDEAEKEIGFITKNYQIRIEALAMASGEFIITVTRSVPDNISKTPTKKKLSIRKKSFAHKSSQLVYEFYSFEDFCSFVESFSNSSLSTNIAKNIILYLYDNTYYLVLKNINLSYPCLTHFYSFITEFATCNTNPDLFIIRLQEFGKIIMKHNAIKTGIEFFTLK